MPSKKLTFVAVAGLMSLLLTYCGTGTNPASKDAGTGGQTCSTSNDCPSGWCKNKVCVTCPQTACATGEYCNTQSKCVPCNGTCPSSDGGSSGSCSHKTDCPSTLACTSGKCQYERADGRCITSDDCASGRYCNFGSCVDGCGADSDCALVAGKTKCELNTNTCVACLSKSDCTGSDECILGECKPATTCTDRTGCSNGLACINSKCAACVNPADCGGGFTCNAGKCQSTSGSCTSDQSCRSGGYSQCAICNMATGACDEPCPGACTAAGTCPATDGGTNPTCDCNALGCNAMLGQTCDTATCSCVTGGGSDGGTCASCLIGGLFPLPITDPTLCAAAGGTCQ